MCNDIYKITGKYCQNFLFSNVRRCLPVKIRGYLPGNNGFRSVSTGYRFLNLDFNFVRYLAVTGAYRSVYRYRQKPGTALPSVSRTLGVLRVSFTDRTGQTAGVRYRYTGPVWPETGRYRSNSNLNSKNSVQPVRTGIPAGLTGLN